MLSAVPASALAQPQDRQARTHFESGRSYYEQGRYDAALSEFQEAYRLASAERKPIMLFNIGQTQERLGHLPEAIASFRQYLSEFPQAEDRATVETRVQGLQDRLDATRIVVTANEDGASVLVDGAAVGTTPLAEPVRVTPGPHEIRVEKEGFRPFTLRVTVPVGEEVSAEADLASESAAAPPDDGAGATSPDPAPEEGGRFYTWIAAGLAGVAVAGGSVLGVLALGERDDANAAATGSSRAYDDAKSGAESMALFADVSFGVAVLAGGAAAALFFLEPGWGESETQANLVPVFTADATGLVATGRF